MAVCIAVIIYVMARDKACIKYDGTTLRMLSVYLKMENPEKTPDYVKCAKLVYFCDINRIESRVTFFSEGYIFAARLSAISLRHGKL